MFSPWTTEDLGIPRAHHLKKGWWQMLGLHTTGSLAGSSPWVGTRRRTLFSLATLLELVLPRRWLPSLPERVRNHHSMLTGPEKHPRAIVLIAPFTSIPDLLSSWVFYHPNADCSYWLFGIIPLLSPLKPFPAAQGIENNWKC